MKKGDEKQQQKAAFTVRTFCMFCRVLMPQDERV